MKYGFYKSGTSRSSSDKYLKLEQCYLFNNTKNRKNDAAGTLSIYVRGFKPVPGASLLGYKPLHLQTNSLFPNQDQSFLNSELLPDC
jgi:hypothetical protein